LIGQKEFFDLLGIKIPIRVIDTPTEIEELIVPGQGFGLGAISAGTEKFRNYFADNFATNIKADGSEKLYLSRSMLGGLEGGAVLEERLEQNLVLDGYEVCHPQRHSISEQIAKYRAAKVVLGLDGSAFHLFAFVGRPDQKVGIVLRRNSNVFHGLRQHVESFCKQNPTVIKAVTADWIPENKTKPGRYSFGQLDFGALSDLLMQAGFVSGQNEWDIPRFRDMKQAMQKFSRAKGREYIRVKNSGKIEIVEAA